MNTDIRTTDARYPMQAVAARTGLTPPLLRAWERRYGAVEPVRSPAGERLYTDRQIHRLNLLRMLTHNGHRISRIARLPEPELERLLLDVGISPFDSHVGAKDSDLEHVLFGRGLAALNALDNAMLEQEVERARTVLSPLALIDGVLCPLIRRAEDVPSRGPVVRAASQGMVRLLVEFSMAIARQVAPLGSGRGIAVWSVGNDRDPSLAMASTAASLCGLRTRLLHDGASLQEVAEYAAAEGPGDIIVSIPCGADAELVATQLIELREHLDPRATIFCVAPIDAMFRRVEELGGLEVCATFRELADLIDTNRG